MNELKLVKEEDIIWLISFFVIILAVLSNKYEKEFLLTNNILKKNLSRDIITSVLVIAFFIYLYFVIITYKNLQELKNSCNKESTRIAFERFISAILFIAAGAYALYVYQDAINSNLDQGII